MLGLILAIVIAILVAAWLLRSQTPWKILTWGLDMAQRRNSCSETD